jgi:hypothetical protein
MSGSLGLDAIALTEPRLGYQINTPQVIEKSYLGRYVFDTRPDFSSFRRKIVIGIDK